MIDRRRFVRLTVAAGAGLGTSNLYVLTASGSTGERRLYEISLAQWSLHRMLRAGNLDALAFPTFARQQFDIGAVEYVNVFFQDRVTDLDFLRELRSRAGEAGVSSLLIMVDAEGRLGDPDPAARTEAVERHSRWVEAAAFLGCHSIRVNAESAGSRDTQRDLAAAGLRRLTEFAADRDLNVIVENHGGLSSDASWLVEVIRLVDHPRCGTLPDFDNFGLADGTTYDRYRGVRELMPFAKAVSAKSFAFDEDGFETTIDFRKMMRIVVDAGYRGYVGIEFEGNDLSEVAGIRATKSLLERIRAELEANPAYEGESGPTGS
jgi:sugar phosphate isomerase/epimerase